MEKTQSVYFQRLLKDMEISQGLFKACTNHVDHVLHTQTKKIEFFNQSGTQPRPLPPPTLPAE